MHRAKYVGILLVALMVVAAVMTATPTTRAQAPKVLHSAFLPGDVKIDPSLAEDANSITLLNMMYVGLTNLNDVTVATEPGIATDWSASTDGLTYTFHLMKDIPWVRYDTAKGAVVQITDDAGNPLTVKAQDFVYGWNRTLNPATGGTYSAVLAPWVVNGQEMLNSEQVTLGVKAVDDYTLEVTSPDPAGFLPMLYGLWMARPQLQSVVEQFGDKWTDAGNYVSYGPYTLKDWQHDAEITIIKNPFWPGNDSVPQAKIDEFNFVYLDEPAYLASYEAGELDWVPTIPLSDLDRMRAERPNEIISGPGQCTYYYGFNVQKPPVDNAHMRRALSMAIDRDTIVKILNGGQKPAGFFTLPSLAAAPKQEDYPDYAIHSDPEGAKKELQAYLDETKTTLKDIPPITLMHNTSAAHATIAQAVQQMWKETLGIDITITTQDFAVYQDTLKNDAPHVWRLGWCFDYPDTHNFLYDVFRFTGPTTNNHTNWANPDFQKLLDQAKTMSDNVERSKLYAQAEDLLVNKDAAIAPIYFYTTNQLTGTYVTRTLSATGNEALEKWDMNKK